MSSNIQRPAKSSASCSSPEVLAGRSRPARLHQHVRESRGRKQRDSAALALCQLWPVGSSRRRQGPRDIGRGHT
ncbi:hypothetical protein V5799_024453 [Amblyomma americanum]|uniref:Uncharacterized protein n=1 Tax=Amblyomma americanum TaxID=6943 RepID=A0AAQ4ECI0_AMBAM